ncbi:MAG: hypothetical protein ACO1OO_06495 [Flavisolibacter sp.]
MIGKEKSTGAIAGAKLAAFLETSDGELTPDDFQEVTDHFYNYFVQQLQAAGVETVKWDVIANTEFMKNYDEKDDDKNKKGGNVWMTSTANKGPVVYGGTTGFAFGKAKKAGRFCEEIGAPAAFILLTVDFADILLNVDIKTSRSGYVMAGYPITKTRSFKYNGTVMPEMNITPSAAGTISLLWNEKMQAESVMVTNPIYANEKYHNEISEDPSRVKRSAFAFAKSLKPVVIETTREQYKQAAKKALERYADAFIEKAKTMKK